MLEKITPLIITYNESLNINRTIERLTWANRIVVIDSYSTDETLDILKSYSQVEIFFREFDSFANQCNYGLQKIDTEWVLSLDADYVLNDFFIEEIKDLKNVSDGYFVNFKYCVFGQPLKGTLLPPRQVLYRKEKAHYVDDGHAHHVIINGDSSYLNSYIYHDDRKPLSRWLKAQDNYMSREIKKFSETSVKELSFPDKIRQQKLFAPLIIFFYCLIIKRGILDGWAGWYYAYQRMLAEILLSIYLIEQEVK